MTAQSADQVAANWAARLAASTDKMQSGAQAVTVAPGVSAARQKAVWATNVAASQQKWATNVAAVPLATWQADYVNKGLPRVGTGAQNAVPKMTSFFSKLLPAIATGKSRLPARGTYDQNKARASAWMDYMHSLSGQLKG
jgi:hypothetical protein